MLQTLPEYAHEQTKHTFMPQLLNKLITNTHQQIFGVHRMVFSNLVTKQRDVHQLLSVQIVVINPLNAELNPICHLLTLLRSSPYSPS